MAETKRVLLLLVAALTLLPRAVAPASTIPPAPGPAHDPPEVVVEATGYTASPAEGTADGITFTGTRARPGVCAADPAVFLPGTVLWVQGYGLARVEDTGAAIKGRRLDLYFERREDALAWGRRQVRVRVLWEPPQSS